MHDSRVGVPSNAQPKINCPQVNQGLEDKLLRVVDRCETEKNALNRDLQELTSRLVDAQLALAQLREENVGPLFRRVL